MTVTDDIVGLEGEPFLFPVDESKALEFARAVRDDHADPAAVVVPPTFPAFAASAYETLDILEVGGFDLRRVLHGEQEYVYTRPLRVGERLVGRSTVVSDQVREGRRGGRMRMVVLETELRNQDTQELVVTCRSTVIELPEVAG